MLWLRRYLQALIWTTVTHTIWKRAIFGRPIEECKKSDDIYVCHYKYDYDCTFNEYTAFSKLAIITLGLSEIIMTPYAIYDCGKTNIIKFAYDYNNAVLTFLIGDFEIKPLN